MLQVLNLVILWLQSFTLTKRCFSIFALFNLSKLKLKVALSRLPHVETHQHLCTLHNVSPSRT